MTDASSLRRCRAIQGRPHGQALDSGACRSSSCSSLRSTRPGAPGAGPIPTAHALSFSAYMAACRQEHVTTSFLHSPGNSYYRLSHTSPYGRGPGEGGCLSEPCTSIVILSRRRRISFAAPAIPDIRNQGSRIFAFAVVATRPRPKQKSRSYSSRGEWSTKKRTMNGSSTDVE